VVKQTSETISGMWPFDPESDIEVLPVWI